MPNLITIVTCTRNDNHGGNLIERTNTFLNSLAEKLIKFELKVELIIVEWNKIENSPSITKTLDFEKIKKVADVKVISVPASMHNNIENSDKIHFFQMIAKNVGIRRAKGDFIICTNIDIIFNDELMIYLKNTNLIEKMIYRVDRHDLSISSTKIFFNDQQLNEHVNYINCMNYTYDVLQKRKFFVKFSLRALAETLFYFIKDNNIAVIASHIFKKIKKFKILNINLYFKKLLNIIFNIIFSSNEEIHTNACGDFMMLDKKSWHQLCGYWELPIFSWHLDSLFLWKAHHSGIKFKNLDKNIFVYHLSHESGGSLQDLDKMYSSLKKNKIPYISDEDFMNYITEFKNKEKNYFKLNEDFGLRDYKLNVKQIL